MQATSNSSVKVWNYETSYEAIRTGNGTRHSVTHEAFFASGCTWDLSITEINNRYLGISCSDVLYYYTSSACLRPPQLRVCVCRRLFSRNKPPHALSLHDLLWHGIATRSWNIWTSPAEINRVYIMAGHTHWVLRSVSWSINFQVVQHINFPKKPGWHDSQDTRLVVTWGWDR